MYEIRRVEIVSLEVVSEPEADDLFSQVESKVDCELLLNKLPSRYKKIAQLLAEGYKRCEIVEQEKCSYHTIEKAIKALKEIRKSLSR